MENPAQARSAAVGPTGAALQARTQIQARFLMSDGAIAKLPPHGRRKRLAVDPEQVGWPWCCSGTVLQSRTAQATITTFCPQPSLSSSTYKNARRRTARALSQHFANLYSSHTKLENDTKWWASRRASWRFWGHITRESHRQLVHDSRHGNLDSRQVGDRHAPSATTRAGFLAAKTQNGQMAAWRFWCGRGGGLVSCHWRGDGLVVHLCILSTCWLCQLLDGALFAIQRGRAGHV